MSLGITLSVRNDKVIAGTASQLLGDPYFTSCPPVILRDQYGRETNSIHETPTNLSGMGWCHDRSDVIDTEGSLTRSAWITATQQPVNWGGGSCGVNLGSRGYDTGAWHREAIDAPQYRLFSAMVNGSSDFGI